MRKLMALCLVLAMVASAAWAANVTKPVVNVSNVAPVLVSDVQMDAVKSALLKYEAGEFLTAGEKSVLETYWNSQDSRYEGNGLDATGGPDAYGYTWVDNADNPNDAPYEWMELCGDPSAFDGPSGDDAAILAPLGFNFTYYGTVYTGVYLSTNGTMSFGTSFSNWSNVCINTTNTNNMICAYWDDMITAGASNGCNGNGTTPFIRYWSDNAGHFIAQYQKMDPYSGTGVTTFQVHIRSNGTIKVVFSDDPTEYTHASTSATVGLEAAGANGLQYLCNVAGIVPGRVIQFNPPSQDPTGRCCYGDPCIGYDCAENLTALECAALGGLWAVGASCTSSPCPAPAPQGDLCCNAFPVPGVPFTATGTTCGFANNYDAVCPYAGGTAPDVVYSFTPAVDMDVTFSLCLSGYDTKLYIYDGAPTPGGEIACNDDASPCPGSTGSYRSLLECVPLLAGHNYCIVVDGYGTACGDYVLTMEECVACDIVCPEGSRPEGEVGCGDEYVDNFNGGCNVDPPAFGTIGCGEVVCGTAWTFLFQGASYRDTDWYLFTVTEDMDSNLFCLTTEFAGAMYIFPFAPCADINGGVVPPIYFAATEPCVEICFDACLLPGDYIVIVLPQAFTGLPCESQYVLSRTCRPCAEPFVCDCPDHPNTHCEYALDNTTYPISDAIPTTFVTINVPIEYQITDLNVCLDIVHTYDGDLEITLTSPMGTVVDLSMGNGGSGDNFTCTTFDDEATTAIGSGVAPFSGSFIPDSPLAAVDGENAVGAWVLAITDLYGGDDGWLNWVCLTFEYDEILPVAFGSFDAVAGNGLVTLNWNTLSETDVDHFELSRNGS
ncbi:proprotein convertase P-domain-containing protein, partial [bacterium]|nr:proprotein convertase P-domain-containing protein [bacterium]